ncbi:hypothetical protein M413DRAFT_31913 [Hebeloma cylindrosporum]|uniref:Uncharacterized protein n=1 Tax=Hebeloma cylindrosporum TaxID=76867 RepID=A0A0C3BHI4_HEBCY|nr:hypothetical protein M413DRAFT_31913 [Hebeloma cylindrosporum h7]
MAWYQGVLSWLIAFYYVLYDHIASAIRAVVAVFKTGQGEPILPIAVTRNSFNGEFNPVMGGIPVPWVQFNPAMRRYSPKPRRSTPAYGTYPPSNPTPGDDTSVLDIVPDHTASSSPLSPVNTPSHEGSLETSALPMDNALVVYRPVVASPIASPSALDIVSEIEQVVNLSKGEVTNDVKDVDSNALAMVRYQPVFGISPKHHGCIDILAFASRPQTQEYRTRAYLGTLPPSVVSFSIITELERAGDLSKEEATIEVKDGDNKELAMVRYQPVLDASYERRGGVDIPAAASSSTFENNNVIVKRVLNVPIAVNRQSIQRDTTFDMSGFFSPRLESVFKTFVGFDDNRLSAILDQGVEFSEGPGTPLPPLPSRRRGGIDIPAAASSSTARNKKIKKRVCKAAVLGVAVNHQSIRHDPQALDMSPQIESANVPVLGATVKRESIQYGPPQLEFFKTYIPVADGNRVSAILDDGPDFLNRRIAERRVPNAPVLDAAVKRESIQYDSTLDISAFMSPQLEFESVFKTYTPDVDSDGNRLSAILDQGLEGKGAPLPNSALIREMTTRFRRKSQKPIIKALVQTAGADSLDALVLEPRDAQKRPSLTLMEKCLSISILVRSSPIVQEETLSESNQHQVNDSESFLSDPPVDSFSIGLTGIRPLSGTSSLPVVAAVESPPTVPEDSAALVMSIATRLAADWDDDDLAYDPRARFEEDSDTGDEGDDEISSTSSGIDQTASDYLPARDLENINKDVSSPLEDSRVFWVDSPVSESTSPSSEDDGSDVLEVPSAIILKPIRKHSSRRLGIYGSFVVNQQVSENYSPEVLVDSPLSDSTSPTSVGGESDEFERLSKIDLERSRKHLNRRLGIFGGASSRPVVEPAQVPFPVPVEDGVVYNRAPPRRPLLLSTHSSIRSPRKRISGLQPLQLPRIVSMRHLAIGVPSPVKNAF